ncbi:MAG: PadR family transcriptional regulator, partial [Mycobacterium sp.]
KITAEGLEAVTRWANEAPVDPPTLKHGPLLRVTLGHLTGPERIKEVLQEHLTYADEMHRKAAKDARWAGADPSWAYARVALEWAERYYANERELALKMIKELDEAEAAFPQHGKASRAKILWPPPEFWYEIEKKADAEEPD